MFYLGILLLSVIGFFISFYIYIKKKDKHRLVCPFGGDCNSVLKSKYAQFFGVSVEWFGMLFFGFVFLYYIIAALFPFVNIPAVEFFVLIILALASSFQLFLLVLQLFIVKKRCSWCIIITAITFLLFIFSWHLSVFGYVHLLREFRFVVLMLHVASMGIGLGGATITDFFFFKFLKDLKISKFESNILHSMSEFIWFALAVATLSGIGLFLPEMGGYLDSSKFITKMFVVGVIIINGFFLNHFVSPQLVKISFTGKPHHHYKGELVDLRRIAFALGGISIASWYTAFTLGMLRSIPIPAWVGIGIYVLILVCAVIGSQIAEYRMCRMKKS